MTEEKMLDSGWYYLLGVDWILKNFTLEKHNPFYFS